MSRVKINIPENNEGLTLDDYITRYVGNKSKLDSYKKLVDNDNAEIKRQMKEANITEREVGDYVAKYSVSNRESMNEDKLMDVIKKYKFENVIKTKEYIDMDALETYLYNHDITKEQASDLDSCRQINEVVTLRISKAKKKKEDK